MSTSLPTIQSLPEQGAYTLTLGIIDAFEKTPAAKLSAAETAMSVATLLSDMGAGNVDGAAADFKAMIGNIKDPALAALANNLFNLGTPVLKVEMQAVALTPVLGTSIAGYFTETAKGMTNAAQVFISAYGQKPAA